MNTSKAAVVVNAILGKIASIIGYVAGLFSFFMIIGAMFFKSTVSKVPIIIFFLIILGLSIFLVIKGIRIKKQIERFKLYVGLISSEHMTSLDNIARSTSQSVDFVRNDLQKMINKNFFVNATIDIKSNEISIGSLKDSTQDFTQVAQQNMQTKTETAKCSGCGAMNTILQGIQGNCEYCGSTLE